MPGFMIGGRGVSGAPTNIGEFRRKHRWRFQTAGNTVTQEDFIWLKSAARPSFKFEPAEVHHDQEVTYYAGKQTWDTIPLQFYDNNDPRDISSTVYQWLNTVSNIDTAVAQLPSAYKKDVELELIDNTGEAEESWTLFGAFPLEINWEALDYTSSEIQLVSVTLRYDRARRN